MERSLRDPERHVDLVETQPQLPSADADHRQAAMPLAGPAAVGVEDIVGLG